MSAIRYREVTRADAHALARVYVDAVRTLAPERYTPLQVEAWAGTAEDARRFAEKLDGYIVAGFADASIVGFASLHPDDRVALLYCAPAWGRRGIASELLWQIEAEARRRGAPHLRTEASQFSRPLFARHGFALVEVEHCDYNGAVFERYLMRKELR